MRGIADYEFIKPIGAGNHGQYFLARRPARVPVEAEMLAVKVLGRDSTSDTFRKAIRDLRAFAAVRSPYLVGLYDAGQQDGLFYYAAEFVPGGSLADPAQPIEAALALRAISDAARAVSALHGAGIVHRGIKPGNVLLDPYGAKLSDLDLSRVFAPGLVINGAGSVSSLEYVDPGLLLGEPPAPHHDVWSLGVLLHRVAAGVGIYGELPGDGVAALRRVVGGRPEISPALPGNLANAVRECLSPPDRRPTAAALADRLAG